METIKTTEYVPRTISANVYTFDELGEAEEREQDEEPDEDGRRYGCYATMDAQGEYCAWFDEMLADVAAAYNKLVEDEFDYFYCGEGMREYWNDCCELETEGCYYFEDGEDATAAYRAFLRKAERGY